MSKIGIYGGSFNPIHYGHIGVAQWTIEHTDLDEIWLMVSPQNPMKDSNILSDAHNRVTQAQLAIQGLKNIRISDFELSLPQPSYTANTLRCLQQTYPQHQFSLIIGEDNLRIFHRWREAEWIANNFDIYVYPRHNNCLQSPTNISMFKRLHIMNDAPYLDISSTEIRTKNTKQ